MCDTGTFKAWLWGILGAITLAIGLIVAAAVANGSFWKAWLSPPFMLAAAAAAFLAVALCGTALSALNAVCECARGRCEGQCYNLRNVLNAARTVLGIQASACLAAAAKAWIPYVGQPVMWIIIGALTIQAALIVSAIAFTSQLDKCAAEPPATSRDPLRVHGSQTIPTRDVPR